MNLLFGIVLFLYSVSNVVTANHENVLLDPQDNVIEIGACTMTNSITNNDLKRLGKDLICQKSGSYPLSNQYKTLYVTVKFIPTFIDIMEDDKLVRVHGDLDLSWRSEKLQWNPSTYGSIEQVIVKDPAYIYVPNITRDDSLSTFRLIDEMDTRNTQYTTINSNGSVTLRLVTDLYGPCEHKYQLWPFDKWTCTFFLIRTSDDYTVKTNEFDPERDVDSTIVRGNRTSWEIVPNPSDFVRANTPENVLELTVTLERDGSHYRHYLSLPGFVLLILSLTTFWQRDQILCRLMNNMFIGVVQVILLLYTLWLLRDTGSKGVALLDFFVASFLTSSIGVLLAIVNSKLTRKTIRPSKSITDVIDMICQMSFIGPVVSYFILEQDDNKLYVKLGHDELEQFEELTPSESLEWKIVMNTLDKSFFILIVIYFIFFH